MPSSVSVIIPVYNGARFVAEAVQSALDQDYQAKEIIVVNDGSTDDTIEILRGFGDAIRVIDQQNSGPPRARNAGLRMARGDYIAFLDADDVWTKRKLSAQVAYLEAHPEVGTVFTAWHVWSPDADGRFRRPDWFDAAPHGLEVNPKHSGWIYNRLLFECELLTTTVMIRASVVRAIGEFDHTLFNGDDYDYWIRASRVAQISKLKCVTALYRVVPSSVSRRPHATNFEYEVVRKALARWGLVGPDGTATDSRAMDRHLEALVLSHGHAHLQHGDPRVALAIYKDAVWRHPATLRFWVDAARALVKLGGATAAAGKSLK